MVAQRTGGDEFYAPANWLDRAIAVFAPGVGLKRALNRRSFALVTNEISRTGWEGADPSRYRRFNRDGRSGEALARRGAIPLRNQARSLERDNPIIRGGLDRLTDFVVGPKGIGVEPQPKRRDGTIHEAYAARLTRRMESWGKWPEVTWTHDWVATQRLAFRSFARDGEILSQIIEGPRSDKAYASDLPFALEMLEADFLPYQYDVPALNVRQGIQRNSWGRPVGYYVYLNHPGDDAAGWESRLKFIESEAMLHVRLVDRFHQLRGVSLLASVIPTMQDVGEYKQQERIAAKMAASMVLKLTHGAPEMFSAQNGSAVADPKNPPIYRMEGGMVVVSTPVGGDAEFFDTKRPNVNGIPFVEDELRTASAGFGLSFSSFARKYNGTYSAQRQELVENYPGYQAGTMLMVAQFVRPIFEKIVDWDALLEPIPADVDPSTIHDALYSGPPLIWIDPSREADANLVLVQAGFTSRSAVIRGRGERPDAVDTQRAADAKREKSLSLATGVSPAKTPADPANPNEGESQGGGNIADLRTWLAQREAARRAANPDLEHA